MITAIPQIYRGVLFRSTLESDWAATLDHLGITWQYEPEGVRLPSGTFYRPDFFLPYLDTWLEVKGPVQERVNKTYELAAAVQHGPHCSGPCESDCVDCINNDDCGHWWDPWQLVIIGYAPNADRIEFSTGYRHDRGGVEAADIATCQACSSVFFYAGLRSFRCRRCNTHDGDHHLASCDETFRRAPRDRG